MNQLEIKTIYLCDDDEDDKVAFIEAVKEVNHAIRVEYVRNGKELMNLLQHFCPEVLFLDLEMPKMNGLQCLVEIRQNPSICNLPVVVFSSTNRPSNIQTAYEMGANLFLIKSSYYAEFNASIKAILALDWRDPNAIKEQYCVNGRYTAFS